MKMVAASKLRRAQEKITAARPYAQQMQRVLGSVASRVGSAAHPLLTVREIGPESKTLVIVVSADKGLCGSFNTNIIKSASSFVLASQQACALGLVGRKGRDFFGRRGFTIAFDESGIFQRLKYSDAQRIAQTAMDVFIKGEVDRVMLIYNEFRSVISQKVVIDQLLPVARADVDAAATTAPKADPHALSQVDYLYEPSAQAIFDQLLPRYVEVQVYRALLDSNAAFFAAQMTAMDTATKNSAEMIGSLTLYMNKVRQAAITREIIEVVSGAQAL
jgi:F-type H+-transporting ATPase subunit gamma